jgi:hypothetical protein
VWWSLEFKKIRAHTGMHASTGVLEACLPTCPVLGAEKWRPGEPERRQQEGGAEQNVELADGVHSHAFVFGRGCHL